MHERGHITLRLLRSERAAKRGADEFFREGCKFLGARGIVGAHAGEAIEVFDDVVRDFEGGVGRRFQ